MPTSLTHYEYIEKHGKAFSDALHVEDITTLLVAHGDKSQQYADVIAKTETSFNKGAMVHLLSYVTPFSSGVRNTKAGWVHVHEWLEAMLRFNPAIKQALKELPD